MTMDWKYTILGYVYSPWRLYMVVTSLINAFAYCIFLCLPESPKFMLAMGKPQEALDILIMGYKANGGKEVSWKFVEKILWNNIFGVFGRHFRWHEFRSNRLDRILLIRVDWVQQWLWFGTKRGRCSNHRIWATYCCCASSLSFHSLSAMECICGIHRFWHCPIRICIYH